MSKTKLNFRPRSAVFTARQPSTFKDYQPNVIWFICVSWHFSLTPLNTRHSTFFIDTNPDHRYLMEVDCSSGQFMSAIERQRITLNGPIFSQHCNKRKRWMHQSFNICWQMVSCWLLLMLYLLIRYLWSRLYISNRGRYNISNLNQLPTICQ